MAWGVSRKVFGTCGNFKFVFYDLTDVKATRSLIKPMLNKVSFVASTNTSDNADVFNAKTLNWTGTQDSIVANQLNDAGEVFDTALNGLTVYNNMGSDASEGIGAMAVYSDANTLLTFALDGNKGGGAATTLFNASETYIIDNERIVEVVAQDAGDDGTLFVMGV